MLKIFQRINPMTWLLAVPVLFMVCPWFRYKMPTLVPFLLSCCWIVMTTAQPIRVRHAGLEKNFLCVCFWFLMASFGYNLRAMFGLCDFTSYHHFSTILSHGAFLVVAHMMVRRRQFRELKFLAVVAILGFALAGAMASRGLAAGVEGARSLVGSGDKVTAEAAANQELAIKLGLGSYAYMFMCCVLPGPFLIASFMTNAKVFRWILWAAIVGCLISLKTGGLGTPVLCAALSTGLGLVFVFTRKPKLVTKTGWIAVFCLLIFTYFPSVLSPLAYPLRMIAENTSEQSSLRYRFESLADALKGDTDAYAYQRYERQRISLETFFHYPLFGVGYWKYENNHKAHEKFGRSTGGHSYLFDLMATRGLAGLISLICFFAYLFKYFKTLSILCLGNGWMLLQWTFFIVLVFVMIADPLVSFAGYWYFLFTGIAFLIHDYKMFHAYDVPNMVPRAMQMPPRRRGW